MIKSNKKKLKNEATDVSPSKKIKLSEKKTEPNLEKPSKLKKLKPKSKKSPVKTEETTVEHKKKITKSKPINKSKVKLFGKDHKAKNKLEKPADWNEFKKKKKEVQVKRKQNRDLYDVIVKAKKIGEDLRRKTLKDGLNERKRLTEELHSLLGGQNNYAKLVLSHDMARIVQYLLKFSSEEIRREIAKELIPSTLEMIQSKYAKFCVKHMLKYGDSKTRSEVIRACYGHAVKLTSHAVSAAVLDYGFTTWATTQEKRHVIQEFYGDMYKQSKDDSLTHVRDAYKNTPEMKIAVLGAMKGNLSRIINKELLDSHIVQTVVSQYLQECSNDDRSELITQLASHIVVLSNSKEGAHAAMECFWHGTNKDKKVMTKAIKEHIIDMCKNEHAHNTIICVLDSIDDTVLLNKVLLGEIVSNSLDLVGDEWGRRVLLWLVAPADHAHFHPNFVKELNEGRQKSGSKKDVQVRRNEILKYCAGALLQQVASDTEQWTKSVSVAVVTFAILKAGSNDDVGTAYINLANIIANPEWKVVEGENETVGVENAGFHMMLKKLLQHDKTSSKPTFATALVNALSEKTIRKWINLESGCNRACFLLVHILENSTEDVQKELIEKISSKTKDMLNERKDNIKGASILLKKL